MRSLAYARDEKYLMPFHGAGLFRLLFPHLRFMGVILPALSEVEGPALSLSGSEVPPVLRESKEEYRGTESKDPASIRCQAFSR